jgi:hypothetical protein
MRNDRAEEKITGRHTTSEKEENLCYSFQAGLTSVSVFFMTIYMELGDCTGCVVQKRKGNGINHLKPSGNYMHHLI